MIGIDGAPLGKSTERTVWPVLCSSKGSNDVHIVGIFLGNSKPADANEFLQPMVDELIELVNNGIQTNGKEYNVRLYALVCDAPAKAFLLGLKNHTGYYSYPRSILAGVPKFGPVTNVVVDPMHQVYLGPGRKLIMIWMARPIPQIPSKEIKAMSDKLVSFKDYITYDFARRPRSLQYMKYFKATELRTFLLYTAIVAGKGFLPVKIYEYLLTLHIALTILNRVNLCEDEETRAYAGYLLSDFVEKFEETGLVRKGDQPLQQLMRRCAEIEAVNANCAINRHIGWSQQEGKGPMGSHGGVMTILRLDQFTINCKDGKNGCVMIETASSTGERTSVIVECECIYKSATGRFIIDGKVMDVIGDFYTKPIRSPSLGMNVIRNKAVGNGSWSVENIVSEQDRALATKTFFTMTSSSNITVLDWKIAAFQTEKRDVDEELTDRGEGNKRKVKEVVEIVPVPWFISPMKRDGGKVRWPADTPAHKLTRLIQKCTLPEDDWTTIEYTRILGSAGTWDEANVKVDLAETLSDVDAEYERQREKSKRHAAHKKVDPNYDYDSTDSSSDGEPPEKNGHGKRGCGCSNITAS
ncbi:hypothetical protein QAD02_013130 [Eretmocerus hayati]|uniref:Uncharacterized protein n=1 Tax=Eretmocerus hayati TaxID=131215 RepID=A0ACC2P2L4_9HYME|nr:hypothetical protein QAD02_013130 [Eretmocerus hayati]